MKIPIIDAKSIYFNRNEPYVELTDHAGCVLMLVPTSVSTAYQLHHKSVHIALYDEKKRLCLRKTSTATDEYQWDISLSGIVYAEESYYDAAKRLLHNALEMHSPILLRQEAIQHKKGMYQEWLFFTAPVYRTVLQQYFSSSELLFIDEDEFLGLAEAFPSMFTAHLHLLNKQVALWYKGTP